MSKTIKHGHFYAVGIGPGAPDLVTLRAMRLIQSADIIIAPRSRNTVKSLALEAVEEWVRDDQEIIEHVYAMNRDHGHTIDVWEEMASLIIEQCAAGKSVVQITLGDPMIYSTSCYLLTLLAGRMPSDVISVVPGISAFQAAACKFGKALTIQEDRMILMPATNITQVSAALDQCETLVLYKAGKKVQVLADLLQEKGLLERARLICYAEQREKEFIAENILEAADGSHGYMSTIIVYIDRQKWAKGANAE